jgi:hypothetical protein
MIPSATRQNPRLRFPLQDILALVAGYGMAALLFRAFWPRSRPSPALGLPGLGLYLWLGLAMSGPIILVRHEPKRNREQEESRRDSRPVPTRTWAELAWMLIGTYWIILGVFSIPARLHEFKLGDMIVFGLVPVVLALGFRLFGPRASPAREATTAWTHPAAVVLVITWPVAWACLIVWGRALR